MSFASSETLGYKGDNISRQVLQTSGNSPPWLQSTVGFSVRAQGLWNVWKCQPSLFILTEMIICLSELWVHLQVINMQLKVKLHKLTGIFSSVWFHSRFSIVRNSKRPLLSIDFQTPNICWKTVSISIFLQGSTSRGKKKKRWKTQWWVLGAS